MDDPVSGHNRVDRRWGQAGHLYFVGEGDIRTERLSKSSLELGKPFFIRGVAKQDGFLADDGQA